jgi:hypothetical protein
MMEIWADVPGWSGLYKVSSYGRVASLPRLKNGGGRKINHEEAQRIKELFSTKQHTLSDLSRTFNITRQGIRYILKRKETNQYTTKGKILTPIEDSYGYLIVGLTRNSQTKLLKIHRLVATTFIPNPEGKPLINHKDANKKNNSIQNLEWVTPLENGAHAANNKLMPCGSKNNKAKLTEKKVLEIRARLALGEKQGQLAKEYSVSQITIHLIKSRKTWKHI